MAIDPNTKITIVALGDCLMLVVEIVLNGFMNAKRCPTFRDARGTFDRDAIRDYFAHLGYQVGEVRAIAEISPLE